MKKDHLSKAERKRIKQLRKQRKSPQKKTWDELEQFS